MNDTESHDPSIDPEDARRADALLAAARTRLEREPPSALGRRIAHRLDRADRHTSSVGAGRWVVVGAAGLCAAALLALRVGQEAPRPQVVPAPIAARPVENGASSPEAPAARDPRAVAEAQARSNAPTVAPNAPTVAPSAPTAPIVALAPIVAPAPVRASIEDATDPRTPRARAVPRRLQRVGARTLDPTPREQSAYEDARALTDLGARVRAFDAIANDRGALEEPARFQAARALAGLGRLGEAADRYAALVQRFPGGAVHAEARLAEIELRLRTGAYAAAERLIEQAMAGDELTARASELSFLRGEARRLSGRCGEAREDYQRALQGPARVRAEVALRACTN